MMATPNETSEMHICVVEKAGADTGRGDEQAHRCIHAWYRCFPRLYTAK